VLVREMRQLVDETMAEHGLVERPAASGGGERGALFDSDGDGDGSAAALGGAAGAEASEAAGGEAQM
jgi:hypothetical protein